MVWYCRRARRRWESFGTSSKSAMRKASGQCRAHLLRMVVYVAFVHDILSVSEHEVVKLSSIALCEITAAPS